ncbi:NfuA family Fe-S biogenesis protein [Dokdonella sp.]|uniref:NfuA family Fe-S biogenesis protein n=1 Tax=Dokdonella sp. TaxID=2291710 RepID=UPI0031BE20F3|nr:NfuA family Fe-S biogenesis protein [Dokdonella sp.]
MVSISASAQEYFRKLIEQQALPGLGVRLHAEHPGTSKGDCRLAFCEPADRDGRELEIPCDGFTLFVDADSLAFLEGARIDFLRSPAGGELTIHAPALRGQVPGPDAGVLERVRYVIEAEINPQLAAHGGHVALVEMTPEGGAVLEFGGGCHGCSMVDVTLRNGVEGTLKTRVPEVSAVIDATDHARGAQPYYRSGTGA